MTLEELKTYIRDIRDFPKPGIVFKDITPLLTSGPAFQEVVDRIASPYRGRIDMVLGIESRGFIIGAAVAYALGLGLTLVRKPGKLPHERYAARYELEYGSDTLEIHRDALGDHSRVLIVDDLLATGGTAKATVDLVTRLGGTVHALAFLIELVGLNGRQRLGNHNLHTVLKY
jgi:adenine phosphoribosyltransferase